MSDQGMDPCECIWSHEMAMRRLLSLLRQSQAYCTDNECLQDVPGGPGPNSLQGSDNGLLLMVICWMVVALALFFLRPKTLQQSDDMKPRDNGPGSHGNPPPPPTATN